MAGKPKWSLIYEGEEAMAVDLTKVESLAAAMEFKARHIRAKAEPRLFEAVARALKPKAEPKEKEEKQEQPEDDGKCSSFTCGYCTSRGQELEKVDCGGEKDMCDYRCP